MQPLEKHGDEPKYDGSLHHRLSRSFRAWGGSIPQDSWKGRRRILATAEATLAVKTVSDLTKNVSGSVESCV
jgi:hypothetical protein